MRMFTKIMLASTFTLILQACGGADQEASELHRAIGGSSGTVGGRCKVTSGPNAGKTGTYDDEGWCMGDWGGTECKAADGTSKCQDLKKIVITKPIDLIPVAGRF
ncbi:MAG TPA: hypothetical protein VFO10_23050 [Oligoflexus sp.]|uniref:hypothetical protein n=1 Tax=Oligoflexus sp. TaxID=1971216 RepID=UPI002D7EDE47|nr:hypothetical protein [Oligoflexus sp.]HET9240160.1 hypothetical protein [Oligoflexus sp.]